jgi:signal transduction histidine kinase
VRRERGARRAQRRYPAHVETRPPHPDEARTVLECLVHRLSSPIGAIGNFAHVLPDDDAGARNGILEAGARARALLEGGRRWLQALEADTGEVPPGGADLEAALARSDPGGVCLTFASDPRPALALSEGALACIVREIVHNAQGAVSPEPARVRVRADEDAEGVTLRFRDSGPGWGPGGAEAAFALFSVGDPDAPAAGVGLAIVESLARRHGGSAWGETDAQGGAVVLIRLPRLPRPDEGPEEGGTT